MEHQLTVGNSGIGTSSARNLGAIVDSQMHMEKHVTSVCKSTSFYLRNIGGIKNVLSDSSTIQLVHAMFTPLPWTTAMLFSLEFLTAKYIDFSRSKIMLPMLFIKIKCIIILEITLAAL